MLRACRPVPPPLPTSESFPACEGVNTDDSGYFWFQVAYIRIYQQHHTYGLGNVLFYEAGGAEGAKAAGRFLPLDHWAPTLASVILLPHWSHFAPYSLRL